MSHRHRRPTRRFALLLFATAWGLALGHDAVARESARVSLWTAAGYDDDVLGRPGESSEFPRLSQSFVLLVPSIDGTVERGRFRAAGSYAYSINDYESAAAGTYDDHRGWLLAAWRCPGRLNAALEAEAERFRRSEFADYDLDRAQVTPRLSWSVNDRWTLAAAAAFSREHYPSRFIGDTATSQTDHSHRYDLAVGWRPERRWAIALTGEGIDSASNDPEFVWTGADIGLSLGYAPGARLEAEVEMHLQARAYDDFTVPVGVRHGIIITEPRQDHAAEVEVRLRQRLRSWLGWSLSGSRLDYQSNADGYTFGDTRVTAGLEWSWGRRSGAGLPGTLDGGDTNPVGVAPNLAPRITPGGVEFRCRAPGARRVVLAGSFNGWSLEATPMSGPDRDGIWSVQVPLAPGTYRYMLWVDGDWRRPESAPLYEDDGFGHENGVLTVP